VAVVQEAYVQGVSTRRVDDLVQALGMHGVSKSQVSRLCQELDAEVERFRSRRLDGSPLRSDPPTGPQARRLRR
jgi:transposase-like protein